MRNYWLRGSESSSDLAEESILVFNSTTDGIQAISLALIDSSDGRVDVKHSIHPLYLLFLSSLNSMAISHATSLLHSVLYTM